MAVPSEFHQLLDAAPDAMVVVDRHGHVTALNLEAERFFGWTERELLGEPMSRFFPTRFHRLLGYLESNGGAPAVSTNGGPGGGMGANSRLNWLDVGSGTAAMRSRW